MKTPSRTIIKVAKVYTHPQFRKPLKYHDIGLLKLEKNVEFGPSIRPLCLPQPKLRLELNESVSVAGWGVIGYGKN